MSVSLHLHALQTFWQYMCTVRQRSSEGMMALKCCYFSILTKMSWLLYAVVITRFIVTFETATQSFPQYSPAGELWFVSPWWRQSDSRQSDIDLNLTNLNPTVVRIINNLRFVRLDLRASTAPLLRGNSDIWRLNSWWPRRWGCSREQVRRLASSTME